MKRILLVLLLIVTSNTCLFPQHKITPSDSKLCNIISKYVMYAGDSTPYPVFPKVLYDKSISSISFTGVKSIKLKKTKRYEKFNPKKDDITDVVVIKHYTTNSYEFIVLHSNGKKCDMNEFSIRIASDNLVFREGDGIYDYYVVNGNIKDYLDGTLPMEGDIIITHIQSNLSTKIHYAFVLKSSEWLPGKDGAYLFESVYSNVLANVYSILDLENGEYAVVNGPFSLNTNGRDGRDGRNGYNGSDGLDERDWTDKNGKAHHSKGTCGMPGGNGENGEDGQDGGNSFIFVGPGVDSSLSVSYSGGKGGKGGRGGKGGKHGKGSSCYGRASDGYPGKNGSPGIDGSVQFECSKEGDLMGRFSSSYSMRKVYCSIVINKSIKNKKSKNQSNDSEYTEGAVDF